MNTKWVQSLTGAVLTVALITSIPALPVYADAANPPAQEAAHRNASYGLTAQLQAEIKSIVSEKTTDGQRIGVVVKLANTGSRVTRVPEYELRAVSVDGISYTLTQSAGNAKAVLPQAQVELSYMLELKRAETAELSELAWVKIDEYVYPREETTVLSIPVAGLVWKGTDGDINPGALKKWGESFHLPVLSKNLTFTPTLILSDHTNQGPATLVTIVAENKGDRSEKVPEFTLDGKAGGKTYNGKLVETGTALKPGEKKSLHFVIPTEKLSELESLQVVTPESYVQIVGDKPEVVRYTVGRLGILLPGKELQLADLLSTYKKGDRFTFDTHSKLVDEQIMVSLQDLTLNGNADDGYQTIMAKLLFTNKGSRPLALPNLGMELTSPDGYSYQGVRQVNPVQQLMPNLGYVVNYSFNVPSSEKGEQLVLKLLDSQTVEGYGIPISAYKVAAEPSVTSDKKLSFYPYSATVNSATISYQSEAGYGITYSYFVNLDLEIEKEQDVVSDANSSYMLIELVDGLGNVLGGERFRFTGANRLVTGTQKLRFPNIHVDQLQSGITANIYEAIQTPNGEAKRLLKSYK